MTLEQKMAQELEGHFWMLAPGTGVVIDVKKPPPNLYNDESDDYFFAETRFKRQRKRYTKHDAETISLVLAERGVLSSTECADKYDMSRDTVCSIWRRYSTEPIDAITRFVIRSRTTRAAMKRMRAELQHKFIPEPQPTPAPMAVNAAESGPPAKLGSAAPPISRVLP